MAKIHNKKRNVGLIYEFMVRYMSKSLIDGDDVKFKEAKKIFKKHFKPGTELYREFRLFNSLVKTTVGTKFTAQSILGEAKIAARNYNYNKLNREKSVLIKNINHNLSDTGFYGFNIPEYKVYATIQTLLNDWRNTDTLNIERIARYENSILEWLVSEKQTINLAECVDDDSNSLVLRLMLEKINKKYNFKLSSLQKEILREYVFTNNIDNLKQMLNEIQINAIQNIDKLKNEFSDNKYLIEKIKKVSSVLGKQNLKEINDKTIIRYFKLIDLNNTVGS
jgi:hypothetical protein